MSITCSICHELLIERPTALAETVELIMCALSCGHMYHRFCLQQWFDGNNGNGASCNTDEGECPVCKRKTRLSQSLRLFPTGDEDSSNVMTADEKEKLKELTLKNEELECALNTTKDEISDLTNKLANETAAREIVILEHSEALSKIESQEEDMKESSELTMALQESFSSALDHVEKDKNEALQLLTNFKMKYKDLLSNFEVLLNQAKQDQDFLIAATAPPMNFQPIMDNHIIEELPLHGGSSSELSNIFYSDDELQ